MTLSGHYLIAATLLIVAIGGAVAHLKRDYVSRGMAICFFTTIFGLAALILSPSSKARLGDEHDEHNWPPFAWVAVVGTLLLLVIVKLLF